MRKPRTVRPFPGPKRTGCLTPLHNWRNPVRLKTADCRGPIDLIDNPQGVAEGICAAISLRN